MSIAPTTFDNSNRREAGAPTLRVWTPDPRDYAAAPPLPPVKAPDTTPAGEGEFSPRMTLSRFFELWYLRVVMMREKKNDQDTIDSYRESIAWWIKLTGDPPLDEIDEFVWYEKFQDGFIGATYRRGKLGRDWPLAPRTAVKHMKQVHAVLFRTGPKNADRARPAKGILPEIPHVIIPSEDALPVKPCISLEATRLIFGSCSAMTRYGTCESQGRGSRLGDGGEGADVRWRALLGTLYYLGLRINTARLLSRSMRKEINGRWYFDIPAAAMKEKHGLTRWIHPHLDELLAALPNDGEQYFPFLTAHSETHLLDRHRWLQTVAGLTETHTFHAWRRTHGDRMSETGIDHALGIAQMSLGHKDPKVTRKHYVEIEPKFIRRLPTLCGERVGTDPNQLTLF
jgi:integrase